ncbi:MAG: SLBB domain-containing protein [Ignavibacteriae bacterium]|nr:SLBB domain-containing protein [Ignavibacteriota bacterium]
MKTRIVILLLAVFAVSGPAYAQILEGGIPPRTATQSGQGGAYYNFSDGSGVGLKVSVWGFVRNPGRYYVPYETNILELMSFCGGPNKGALLERVKVVRRGGIDKENEIKEVFEIDLAKYLNVTRESVVANELLLFPGDLILVDGEEESAVDTFVRIAQVVVAISSLVTATVAVLNIAK